jgi:hypothetical protein
VSGIFINIVKRFYFPFLCLFVGWLTYATVARPSSPTIDSYIQTEVIPSGSTLSIDGQGVRAGKYGVASGSHVVIVSKKGFTTKTSTVSTTQSQTVYVGVALQPDSPSTANWYREHPQDQQLAEGLGSHEADYEKQAAIQNNPFLNQLPILYGDGQGGTVNITLGVAISPGGPPAVYVTANTPTDRQGVLAYMRNRGYDPADMDIVFYGQSNPLDNSGD